MPHSSPATTPPATAKPCPHCGAPAAVQQDPRPSPGPRVVLGCSNEINCPVWPVTAWHHDLDAATAAWNRDEVS